MRSLRTLFFAAASFSASLLPATSMAAQHSWCVTGAPLSKTGADPTANEIVTWVCNNKDATCCTDGSGTLRWSLKCVQWADEYGKDAKNLVDPCGRDAWTQGPLPGTQQYFPRDFNIVGLGGEVRVLRDAEDAIAASGNVDLSYFHINHRRRNTVAMVAGGDVFLGYGTVYGDLYHGGSLDDHLNVTYLPVSPIFPTPKKDHSVPITFSTVRNALAQMSSKLSFFSTITVTQKENGTQIRFKGEDPEMNVFLVDSSLFLNTYSYVYDVPSTSAVIINVKGRAPVIRYAGFGDQSPTRQVSSGNLLWNFYEATTLTMDSIGFYGSILAPNATANLQNGAIWGTVVVKAASPGYVELYSSPYHVPATTPALAKQYIKHVVIIMQENRSFDHYFGTFPGANGIPATLKGKKYKCTGTGANCTCSEDSSGSYGFGPIPDGVDPDPPHHNSNFKQVNTTNPPNGYLSPAEFLQIACRESVSSAELGRVLGYHDRNTIPNYWKYAENFVLQDKMFESAAGYSAIEHNYLVSGWNADCTSGTCQPIVDNFIYPVMVTADDGRFYWNEITNLLHGHASWKFYVGENWDYHCTSCDTSPKDCFGGSGSGDNTIGFWCPLGTPAGVPKRDGRFQTVIDNGETGNVVNLRDFFLAAADPNDPSGNNFPQVSWIIPDQAVSEHPGLLNPRVDVKWGQAYVTSIVNAIMKNPVLWHTTAVFLSWDDWGGFYDHVIPEKPFTNDTYGFRVPGLLISPWVKSKGYIDSQTLSHDAYLKFIEDLFLGGQRIGPGVGSAGTKDNRTTQREASSKLGDLVEEFDFSNPPLRPLAGLPCSVPR